MRTAPRPLGNYVELTPQLAKNTILTSRLPKNWTKSNRPFIMAHLVPYGSDVTDNGRLFTNVGFTHIERPELQTKLNLSGAKRFRMISDAALMVGAQAWGITLDNSDPRKAGLLQYGSNRKVLAGQANTWRELGKREYLSAYNSTGVGLGIVAMDIEVFTDTSDALAHEFMVNCHLGMFDGITEAGHTTKVFTYGQGVLADVSNYTKNAQDADVYMRLPWVEWGNPFNVDNNELVTKLRQKGAIVARDKYSRRTWGNETLFQKNTDGSIKTDGNGNPLFVVKNYPNATVNIYGIPTKVYSYEAQYFAEMLYEEPDKILAEWRWACNTPATGYDGQGGVGSMPYPRGPVDIRPGLENLGLGGWYRDDTELEAQWNPATGQSELMQGYESNRRPIHPMAIRHTLGLRKLLYHGNIIWSDKGFTEVTWGQSLTYGGETAKMAWGQFEQMFAANYQMSQHPAFFTAMDAKQVEFFLPYRFVRRGNVDAGDRVTDKPVIWGFHVAGTRKFYAYWCWPVQDIGNSLHNRDITIWFELANGTKSPAYKLTCQDRKPCFDGWQLPAGFENVTPDMMYTQVTSLTGQTYTRKGTYNSPFLSSNPTPPAYAS